jgi:phospholipase/lecithinase/hemolysin
MAKAGFVFLFGEVVIKSLARPEVEQVSSHGVHVVFGDSFDT